MFCLFYATLSICLAVVWISYGTGPPLLVVYLLIMLLEVLHGHGRIWPYPCTLACPNSCMSLYMDRAILSMDRDRSEFGHAPVHGQGWIRPCQHSKLKILTKNLNFLKIKHLNRFEIWPCLKIENLSLLKNWKFGPF